MTFWKSLGGFILDRACKARLDEIAKDASKSAQDARQALSKADASVMMVKELRKQLSACMAIDVGFKDSGKIIILSRVQNQDRVKILNVKPDMTVNEYRSLITGLQEQYGAEPIIIDDGQLGYERR